MFIVENLEEKEAEKHPIIIDSFLCIVYFEFNYFKLL